MINYDKRNVIGKRNKDIDLASEFRRKYNKLSEQERCAISAYFHGLDGEKYEQLIAGLSKKEFDILKKGKKLDKFKDEEKSLSLIFEKFPEKDIFLRGGQLC